MTRSSGRTESGGRPLGRVAAAKAERMLAGAQAAERAANPETALLAYINAAIHAGDALCLLDRGVFSRGQDHHQAVQLLREVPGGTALAKQLLTALHAKKHFTYDLRPLGAAELKRVARAAEALVTEAVRRAS